MKKNEPPRPPILLSKQGKDAERKAAELITRLAALKIPAETSTVAVDCRWNAPSGLYMLDFKRPEDMIASAGDGRLHTQSTAMREKSPVAWGFVIEHQPEEDGITIGYGTHAWNVERFDNLLCSVAEAGAVILHAAPNRLAQRLGSYYLRSLSESHASWDAPTPRRALSSKYADKSYRLAVEFLMGIVGVGEQKANDLLDRWPIRDILGITDLESAALRWGMVKGIGEGTVREMLAFLEQDFSSEILRAEAESVSSK